MRVGISVKSLCLSGIVTAAILLTAPAGAQQTTGDASMSAEQLYRDATASQTVEACTRVIDRLDRALAAAATDAQRTYYTNLLAWTHNRRGEMHAHDAATLATNPKSHDPTRAEAKDKLATADFKKSLELAPDRWKSWHNLAVCDALAGRLDKAVANFSKVIELRPDYVDAWFNRAEVHFELGQFAQAVNDYDEAIRLQPEEAEFHARRGDARFQLRDFDAALADYDRALQLTPRSANYVVDRGDVFRATGQWEKAAAAYRKAITLDQDYGRAYQSAAWLMATCPDTRVRDAGLAIEAAQKAIALDGDGDFIYRDTLAAAYATGARFDDAVKAEKRAIDVAPKRFRLALERRQKLYQNHEPFRQKLGRQSSVRQAKR